MFDETRRNLLKGNYEIEDRALLDQAEYYGYARGCAPTDIGDIYNYNPDNINQVVGSESVGPGPQDYQEAIKRIGLEPGVFENHSQWVEDQMKFTNAYATNTAGRGADTSDLFEGAVPFQGLQRLQPVPVYGIMAGIDDSPKQRIYGDKKFVFTY
jgi:hypothetical protein